jgi:hypothetical protein
VVEIETYLYYYSEVVLDECKVVFEFAYFEIDELLLALAGLFRGRFFETDGLQQRWPLVPNHVLTYVLSDL